MNYVLFNKGQVVGVTAKSPFTGTRKLKEFSGITYDEAKINPDFKSFEEVEAIATRLTELTGETYLAYDNGSHTSHRFGVMVLPKVGDDVSYGFNGDYYPCGKITRITKGFRITATDEKGHLSVFNRRKQTSSWLKVGGTWHLVKGIVDERNPSF